MRLVLELSPEQLSELAQHVAPLLETVEREGASPWLTMDEAAEYLRVSPRTITREIERGRLRSSALGRRRLLHRDDLDALARSGDGGGNSANRPHPAATKGVG